MKYFYNPNNLKSKILSEGVVLKPMWGDKIMMNIVELAPGSEVPLHSHPNEQAGIVLEGEFEFTIGEEKKTVKKLIVRRRIKKYLIITRPKTSLKHP